jgi:hypothetical protein
MVDERELDFFILRDEDGLKKLPLTLPVPDDERFDKCLVELITISFIISEEDKVPPLNVKKVKIK